MYHNLLRYCRECQMAKHFSAYLLKSLATGCWHLKIIDITYRITANSISSWRNEGTLIQKISSKTLRYLDLITET